MAKRKNNNFWSSLEENSNAYLYYLDRFTELSLAMFDWKNLPDTMDPRYLEMALFRDGKAVVFVDEAVGMLGLSVTLAGGFNAYGYPNRRRAISRYSSYQKELTPSDSVLVYNNLMRTNTYPKIRWFADRLWNLDRIIDVNANAQKTPILVQCEENQRLTAENIYKEYDGNSPVIFGKKGLANEGIIQVLKTDSPYVADKIYELKCNIFNEALTFLGIPNSIVNKKERLIKDEVQRDLGGALASRYSRLGARQRACELINKMFGTDIWVEYKDEESTANAVDSALDSLQRNETEVLHGGIHA